jgi:hypothetical protein
MMGKVGKCLAAVGVACAAVVSVGAVPAQAATPLTKVVSTHKTDVRAQTLTATCPTGYVATGGGYWIADNRLSVSGSWPSDDTPKGWSAEFGRFDFPVRGYVYAVCVM